MYSSEFWVLVGTIFGTSAMSALQATVRDMDANLPVLQAAPLAELTAFGLLPQRIAAWIAGSVGAVAVMLAMISIYMA